MNDRGLGRVVTLIAAAVLWALPAASQTTSQPNEWTVPRTPDGQPDLQGVWDFRTMTSLERPPRGAGGERVPDRRGSGCV